MRQSWVHHSKIQLPDQLQDPTALDECFMVIFQGIIKFLEIRGDPICIFFVEYLTNNYILLEKHFVVEMLALVDDPVHLGAVVIVKLQARVLLTPW